MALQGMGVSTFWGFTPAIDLQNAPPAAVSYTHLTLPTILLV